MSGVADANLLWSGEHDPPLNIAIMNVLMVKWFYK